MADPEAALAELIRWHLVDDRDLWGGRLLTMFSPVRAHVQRAACEAFPTDLADVRRRTAFCVAMLVEEVDEDLIHGGRSEEGVALLDRELPNVLHVVNKTIRHAPEEIRRRTDVVASSPTKPRPSGS